MVCLCIELLIIYDISCPLWSSVYECQRVECAFTSLVRTECGMFVMCCMQCSMSMSNVFSAWMFYVELKYNETSHFCCWVRVLVWCVLSCGRTLSVCEVVLVAYVVTDACAVVCVGCEYAERVRG